MQDDQPRPDLDAAIDAVLPSMTAVSDDAAAASLRRTRIALAQSESASRRLAAWRWGPAAAAALIVLTLSLALWHSRAPESGSIVERRPVSPALGTTPLAPSAPAVAPLPVAPQRVARAAPAPRPLERRRSARVQAMSAVPTTPESSRPDPLGALVRAVQRIPEDAWERSAAVAAAPVSAPDVSFSPIVVAPLETPPIADATAEPLAPGEP